MGASTRNARGWDSWLRARYEDRLGGRQRLLHPVASGLRAASLRDRTPGSNHLERESLRLSHGGLSLPAGRHHQAPPPQLMSAFDVHKTPMALGLSRSKAIRVAEVVYAFRTPSIQPQQRASSKAWRKVIPTLPEPLL
jgi:hypothetical protein